ncbi:hypothetical protein HW132_24740 [Brasilonema sp. CT11]|nr:hypothetical protein [Brasilonema sp. CT11]
MPVVLGSAEGGYNIFNATSSDDAVFTSSSPGSKILSYGSILNFGRELNGDKAFEKLLYCC